VDVEDEDQTMMIGVMTNNEVLGRGKRRAAGQTNYAEQERELDQQVDEQEREEEETDRKRQKKTYKPRDRQREKERREERSCSKNRDAIGTANNGAEDEAAEGWSRGNNKSNASTNGRLTNGSGAGGLSMPELEQGVDNTPGKKKRGRPKKTL
jgi:hypothetical protein